MQDFQPLPGRIFGGGGGGSGVAELRRLVGGYPASMAVTQPQPQPQPVKCPRCDSTNTKFCYYNNYNLSQPRHFCKSCRRYWTKGGVLRNVPVGGGCRKSKRPSSSSNDKDNNQRRRLPSSGETSTSASTATTLRNSQITADPPFCPASEIFPSPAPPAAAAMVGFGVSDPPPPQEKPAEAMRAAGFMDQTVPVDPRPGSSSGRPPALDWSGAIDSHFFDLPSVVDPTAYWNQSHWVDADPALYLP